MDLSSHVKLSWPHIWKYLCVAVQIILIIGHLLSTVPEIYEIQKVSLTEKMYRLATAYSSLMTTHFNNECTLFKLNKNQNNC